MSCEEVHFAQHLASNEKRIRDKALSRLRRWLKLRSSKEESEFSHDGMMKLWKGLWYCMWMADKPLVQEELATNIGSLIHSFSKPSQSYLFIDAFFRTMGRNHDHIDKYRIDKFLMLARRFFRASLSYLKSLDWQHKHVQKYLGVLRGTILSTKQEAKEVSLGFRLHIFDVFLEELARVAEGGLTQKRAHNFLEPFYEMLTYCKSPMVVEGIRDKVFYQLVQLAGSELDNGQDEDDVDDTDDDEGAINGKDFINDEAELDEEAEDSQNEDNEVSSDEDEEHLSKRRKRDGGFVEGEDESVDDEEEYDDDDDEQGDEYEGDLEEVLIKQQESEAELHLAAIDFDLNAIKSSLMEYLKVDRIKSLNRKCISSIIKKLIDLENGVNPFGEQVEDSGSDLELDEEELKLAEKRLKLLEKKFADEAELNLIPENDEIDDGDEFEMEGGSEDDEEEFERNFVDSFLIEEILLNKYA